MLCFLSRREKATETTEAEATGEEYVKATLKIFCGTELLSIVLQLYLGEQVFIKSTTVSYNKNLAIAQRLCNLCHSSLSTLGLLREVPSSHCWSCLFLSLPAQVLECLAIGSC